MSGKIRGGTLLIKTAGDQSEVEISGTPSDIMFNWLAITDQVSKSLDIPPIALAGMLPGLLQDYLSRALKYEVRMGKMARD